MRKTRDVDLAFALRSWDEYDVLRQALVASGRFTPAARISHRLYFGSTLEVDIVPFGALESPPGEIAWPPDGAVRMKTFGLDRARSDALVVELADGLRIHVASIRTQALLKVVAWADRESDGVYRDASDLAFLLKSYWEVVQSSDRPQAFWRALAPLLDAPDFDAETTGAIVLGRDVRELLHSPTEIDMVGRIIVKGLGEDGLGPLVLRSGLAEETASQAQSLLVGACRNSALIDPMTLKPTGTVTLLFSDIEDSTSRLAELGADRYHAALEEHRRILRDAIARHAGHEFGAVGDALFVAFGSVQEAIHSAVAAQCALNDHGWLDGRPLRVRMGLHTCEATSTADDYFGMGVHRASRICAAGHGG